MKESQIMWKYLYLVQIDFVLDCLQGNLDLFRLIYSCVIKAEFLSSLLQSSVSHDPSEIIIICWFAAQEKCLIIIIVEQLRYIL